MARVRRLEPDSPPLRAATLGRLERLAGLLTQRGMRVSIVAPPGRVPRLEVVHPADGGAGDIYVSRCRDGSWWFWWPWAERIAAECDLAAAAAIIEQALARPQLAGPYPAPYCQALLRLAVRRARLPVPDCRPARRPVSRPPAC